MTNNSESVVRPSGNRQPKSTKSNRQLKNTKLKNTKKDSQTGSSLLSVGIGAALTVGFLGFRVVKSLFDANSSSRSTLPPSKGRSIDPATGSEFVRMFANHSSNMAKITRKGW